MNITTKIRLKYRLFAIWLSLSVLIGVGAVCFYNNDKKEAFSKLQHTVVDIAAIKVKQFVNWHKDRLADAQMFAQSPFFIDAIYRWQQNKGDDSLRNNILKRLSLVNVNGIYSSIVITDNTGNILVSVGDTLNKLDISTRTYINAIVKDKKIAFTDFYECNTHKTLHIDYIAPVIDKRDAVFAVIVFRVNPCQNLYPIIEEWPSPIESAKNYVLRYDGESVLFLNSIWWGKNRDKSDINRIAISNDQLVNAIYDPGKLLQCKDKNGNYQYVYVSNIPGTSWRFVKVVSGQNLRSYLGVGVVTIFLFSLLLIALIAIVCIIYYYLAQEGEFVRRLAKERQLSSYYKEFQTIFYSIGDGVIITDTQGRVTNMNFEAVKVTGYRESEAFGKPVGLIFRIVNKESQVEVDNPVLKVLKSEKSIEVSNHTLLINREYEQIPISSTFSPIYNDKDEIQGVVLIFRNRALEVEAAKQIKEGEERFRFIMEATNDGLWDWNVKADKAEFSPAYYRMLGYEDGEFPSCSKSWVELLHPDDKYNAVSILNKCIFGELDGFQTEFRLRAKDGTWCWVLSRGRCVARNKKGKATRIVGTHVDITERMNMAQSLKESETRLNLALRVAKMGYWQYHIDTKRIDWYGGQKEQFGFPIEKFNGSVKEVQNLIHPDDRRLCMVSFSNTVENQVPFDISFRTIMSSGEIKWLHSYGYLYKNKNGQDYVFGVTQDITERKLSEETLRQSEERYRMLFNNMTQAFALHEIILDDSGIPVDYRFIDVNDSFEILTGLKPNIVLGNTAKQVMPEIEQYWIDVYGKVALTGEPIRYENYSEDLGRYYDVWAFSPQKGQFATIFSDITKKKKTEETIQKLQKGIEQSPVIVVITDIKGRIEYVNPRFAEVTGYSSSEMIGKKTITMNSSHHSKEFYKEIWTTILGGNDWKGEILNKKKNGQLYWESVLISPIKNEKGEIKFFIEIKEDITERKLNELAIQERDLQLKEQNEEYLAINEELTESNERIRSINRELVVAREKAEENDRLKSAFLANMSHEIRTPMNGIIGFAELLKRPVLTEDERETYVEIIKQSGQRLLDLINNLIDISKIEAGQLTASVSQVNVSAELMAQYNFFKREAEIKGICLLLQGGVELPDLILLTDKQKFVSIVTNLIKNAIKFTTKGTIDYGFSVGQDSVEFYVSDTGMGIEPKMQTRIFERFVQGDISLTRPYEGAGLGLAITKSYVELLGGKISFDSEANVGTSFYFTLPLTKPRKKKISKEVYSVEELMVEEKQIKIMIVEDDKSSVVYLQNLLEPIAKDFINTSSGESAILLAKDNLDIDLILMDIRMPDISGLEVTRRIREFNSKVIIIAQTAFALTEDRDEAILAGCNDYLTKPIKPNDLFKTINHWINSNMAVT